MQKSIFTRYLSITMAIVVLSFIMLGSVMMVFFSQYWRNEKQELLTQNAKSIADLSSVFLSKTGEGSYELQTNVLKGFINTFSTSIDADIFITDLDGNILLGNYPNSKLSQPQSVPQQTVSLAEAVEAPVALGSQLGTLTVTSGEEVVAELPILAGEEIPRITFVQMLVRMLQTAFLAD